MASPKSSTVTITVLSHELAHSDYDWINVFSGPDFVGKIRGKISGKKLTIYTILIFPEYQAHGYGEEVIDYFKRDYQIVAADRVRSSAVGFWTKMGFHKVADETYEYRKNDRAHQSK